MMFGLYYKLLYIHIHPLLRLDTPNAGVSLEIMPLKRKVPSPLLVPTRWTLSPFPHPSHRPPSEQPHPSKDPPNRQQEQHPNFPAHTSPLSHAQHAVHGAPEPDSRVVEGVVHAVSEGGGGTDFVTYGDCDL